MTEEPVAGRHVTHEFVPPSIEHVAADDLAERAADHASNLYVELEHESRTTRFDQVVERATHQ